MHENNLKSSITNTGGLAEKPHIPNTGGLSEKPHIPNTGGLSEKPHIPNTGGLAEKPHIPNPETNEITADNDITKVKMKNAIHTVRRPLQSHSSNSDGSRPTTAAKSRPESGTRPQSSVTRKRIPSRKGNSDLTLSGALNFFWTILNVSFLLHFRFIIGVTRWIFREVQFFVRESRR